MEKCLIFSDREDAARQLAAKLKRFGELKPIIFALPRGGVPIGFEVARSLDAPLDVIIVRKLRHPLSPELAIGAIAEGAEDAPFLDKDDIALMGLSESYIEQEITRQREELDRRRKRYADGRRLLPGHGRVAILVDDGVATGSTMIAAIRAIRAQQPARIVVAVPVASTSALAALKAEADEVICLQAPPGFRAVGEFYRDFHAIEDRTVVSLLMQGLEFGAGDQP